MIETEEDILLSETDPEVRTFQEDHKKDRKSIEIEVKVNSRSFKSIHITS